MPIYVHHDVDIDSCRACSKALGELRKSAEAGFDRFREARDKSEDVWDSPAGEDFRDVVSTLAKAAEQTSDRADELSKALASFVDSMITVRAHLNRASSHAMESGLWVGPDVCDPTWINDPDPLHPTGPWSIEQQTRYATQIAAYNDAVDMVNAARITESDAHAALAAAFGDSSGFLNHLRNSAPWMLAGGATSYLGTAAQQANHWGSIAQTRITQLEKFNTLASETISGPASTAATRAASAFGPAADDAIRTAAQNRALLPGSGAMQLGRLMSEGLPIGGEIGKKIPVAGVFLTGFQTASDLRDAEDAGDVVKIVAKDAGGFLAGTAASSLVLASFAGGPATVAAVGTGVLVAYGVGELIEWAAD